MWYFTTFLCQGDGSSGFCAGLGITSQGFICQIRVFLWPACRLSSWWLWKSSGFQGENIRRRESIRDLSVVFSQKHICFHTGADCRARVLTSSTVEITGKDCHYLLWENAQTHSWRGRILAMIWPTWENCRDTYCLSEIIGTLFCVTKERTSLMSPGGPHG